MIRRNLFRAVGGLLLPVALPIVVPERVRAYSFVGGWKAKRWWEDPSIVCVVTADLLSGRTLYWMVFRKERGTLVVASKGHGPAPWELEGAR